MNKSKVKPLEDGKVLVTHPKAAKQGRPAKIANKSIKSVKKLSSTFKFAAGIAIIVFLISLVFIVLAIWCVYQGIWSDKNSFKYILTGLLDLLIGHQLLKLAHKLVGDLDEIAGEV